jgi:hypothetical protein
MGVPEGLVLLGIGCALVEEVNARGRAVGWWGVILIGVAFVWGSLIS